MVVMMGAFTGVNRFDHWQSRVGILRPPLANRLKTLVALVLMRQRVYQERPRRMACHLTAAGATLYPQCRWSGSGKGAGTAAARNCPTS